MREEEEGKGNGGEETAIRDIGGLGWETGRERDWASMEDGGGGGQVKPWKWDCCCGCASRGVGESGGRARSSPSPWSVETITSAALGGQLRKIFQADFFSYSGRVSVYLNTRALKTLKKHVFTFKKKLCRRKTCYDRDGSVKMTKQN